MLKQPSPFPNLSAAGRELALRLSEYENDPDAIVLGVALAGVPVAREVANFLSAPLDLILIRRLLVGDEVGEHICAVNVAGSTFFDDEIALAGTPSTPLDHFLSEAIEGLDQREQLCRRGRPPADLTGRTVIVVDCGIRTGSTMRVAARAVRSTNPQRLIGAVPVSSREGYQIIAPLFDDLICLMQPEEFINAGRWYFDFRRAEDDRVGELLE
ncbi:MAG TPA: phosphoribosyltransferase family protein [Pyrinomonadaceae bacterium]|nr:phosphoribosyltransferase family protein [Pyrinomonadaceae bacterium]